ncbi:MAG: N-6 DNA methylase [Solirubrobacteraceae bacterium]
MPGLTADSYHLAAGERLGEVVSQAWNRLLGAWAAFDAERATLPADATGGQLTRERWLHVLFDSLGYGRLAKQPAVVIDGKTYPIFSEWQHTPIHLVGCNVAIDRRSAGVVGAAGQSPHSLVQELLNRSTERLWGLVSNGLRLRLVRDNIALTRQAFVEFDLEAMMTGEAYSDFVVLWLTCHQSRVEGERPDTCWLERWTKVATDQGARALDALRTGVEQAISTLGGGFLAHPQNHQIHNALRSGELAAQDYYRQLLRLVYRLLFLFVAEDRDALLDPDASPRARERYLTYYSTRRLRRLADRRRGGPQHDLYSGLSFVMAKFASTGCRPLGLPALGSYLWSRDAIGLLADARIANLDLLSALRALAWVEEGSVRRAVDFRNLGAEELGSVYESLLELHPELHRGTATFTLRTVTGNERRTSGTYYTPTDLITALLDSALEPVLGRAARAPDPEAAILRLAVCDPACGSGHFLIAAANRIGKCLAVVRTGDLEPSPEAIRHAVRDVIGHCVYGVDMNPMAVELCKVSLWVETLDPGRPLSFLDDRVVCGNSLLGATPELIAAGIPDEAYKPLLGDDKEFVTELRKRNARERSGQAELGDTTATVESDAQMLVASSSAITQIHDDSLRGVHERERRFDQLLTSPELARARLLADTWCAAFVAPKRPGAPTITQATMLRVAVQGASGLSSDERKVIDDERRAYGFHHWHVAFPAVIARGGFDVVLGNPPWEHTELKEREFFAARAPTISAAPNKAAREEGIARLRDDDPAQFAAYEAAKRQADGWSHMLRSSGRYPLCGRGRTNTYAVFAELMRTIIRPEGRVGMIVPTGIATDDTTKHFFSDLVERRALVSVLSFENEALLFPQVHHATKFCLLTLTGDTYDRDPVFVFFARAVADVSESWRRFTLSSADIRRVNPNTGTCPIFRSRHDAEITKGIYERIPPFVVDGVEGGNPWNANLSQGLFNMSSDAGLFETQAGEGRMPLYEGKMFWQFDHRYGTYAGQTAAQAKQGTLPAVTEDAHRDPRYTVVPRYWVDRGRVDAEIRARELDKWLIAARGITSAVVNRTMVLSALPATAVGNSALVIAMPTISRADRLAFLACANSFAADYTCRQKASGANLNLFILKQVAIPSPSMLSEPCPWNGGETFGDFIGQRALELVYTANDLAALAEEERRLGSPFPWDEDRRTVIRAELDAAIFQLYGLRRDEVEYIMSTFSVAESYEMAEYGEFRQRRLILERYDTMATAAGEGERYEAVLNPPPADALLVQGDSIRVRSH